MKRYLLILLILLAMSSLPAWELSRPAKAGALSAVLPGGGQIYNKQFVKAGLVIGIQGFLIGSAIQTWGNFAPGKSSLDKTAHRRALMYSDSGSLSF